ncbi:MAG: tRNA (guanosine(46)-N(7))-methyltransferase TrmB [Oligoflexales bacterium]
MPLIYENPFRDPLLYLRTGSNRYLELLATAGLTAQKPCLFYGELLANQSGLWTNSFNADVAEVILEIGSHSGNTLIQMASDHPELGFVGMDITFKRVVKTADKICKRSLTNAAVSLASGLYVNEIFADNELGGIVAFFPDPWNKKKRQLKNRLFSGAFCAKLQNKIKPGGFFWFKSDDFSYFSEVAEVFDPHVGWIRKPQPSHLRSSDYVSQFERQFQEQGLPTYEGVWIKK